MPNQEEQPQPFRGYYFREATADYEWEIGFATHEELMAFLSDYKQEFQESPIEERVRG